MAPIFGKGLNAGFGYSQALTLQALKHVLRYVV
jgi:hypothetical protein